MTEKTFQKFAPMVKFDEKTNIVWFRITSETPDSDKQIMDYEKSKPHFIAHSEKVQKISSGKSKFNVREQHDAKRPVGRAAELIFRDEGKDILAGVEIVDANARDKFSKGVLNGASIGGHFGQLWPDPGNPGYERYEAIPEEFSLVDVPANPDALPIKEFEFVRAADGASEMRKFAKAEGETEPPAPVTPPADPPAPPATDEDPIEKALKIVGASDESLAKLLKEKLSKADDGTGQPAMGAQPEPEPDGDEMTPDQCRAIVLQVLEELGLVQKEGEAMTMAVKPGDLQKSADALTLHKTEVATKIDDLSKTLTADFAKAYAALEDLEKRLAAVTGMGPIIMGQGPEAADDYQIEMLEKLQKAAKTPLEIATIGQQITALKIKQAHQTNKGQ